MNFHFRINNNHHQGKNNKFFLKHIFKKFEDLEKIMRDYLEK